MIEIAIALAVIAFALVAIIGVLPTGINVQKDNREETIINQDGPFWLEAIRNGAKGLDYLTNYVETITVTNTVPESTIFTNRPNFLGSGVDGSMTNGEKIVGLLTLPKIYFDPTTGVFVTNSIVAKVRALTGAATEQGQANPDFAFSYYLTAEIIPFRSGLVTTNSTNYILFPDPEHKIEWSRVRTREENLTDVVLTFRWPLITGPNRQTVRANMSGRRVPVNGLTFVQPQTFTAIPPPP